MAKIELLIPHILLWENGICKKKGETTQEAYERAKAKGVITIKGDSGGPTLCGVTLATFQDWRRKRGMRRPTQADLAGLEYQEWLAILKCMFWDPCMGDRIVNQSVANMIVDWRWVNGNQAIRDAQTAFTLVADGIIGSKTLTVLNAQPTKIVFMRLKYAREAAYRKIIERNPSKIRFYDGWINRTNDIKYEP